MTVEPRQVLVDFSGRFLWVLSFDNSISAFGIDARTGALTGKTHQPQDVNRATQLATLGAVL